MSATPQGPPPGTPSAPTPVSPGEAREERKPRRPGLVRWPGLIAFLLVTLGLAALWLLLIDGVVKRLIERTGTALVGARVELDGADVSLAPLGVTLTRLQVTDPDAPMTNAVEIARIACTLDPMQLLRRKVLIEEMTVDGVRFGTPRSRSGAVAAARTSEKPESATEPGGGFALPALTMPRVEDVLAQADLQSVKLVETMRAELQAEQAGWQQRLAQLPDKARFEQYQAELRQLQKAGKGGLGGLLGGAQQVVELQRRVTDDLARIRTAKSEMERSLARWQERLEAARRAPAEDARRLTATYGLSGAGAGNVTRLLFGPKLAGAVETIIRWEARLRPVLQRMATQRPGGPEVVEPIRGSGVDVRFKEHTPLPDFLVRTAQTTLVLDAGTLQGRLRNVTPDQHVLGAPLEFEFRGDRLEGVKALTVAGHISRVEPDAPHDLLTLKADEYRLSGVDLAAGGEWAVALARGVADAQARLTRVGGTLDGDVVAGFRDVAVETRAPAGSGPLGEAIAGALDDVRAFRLTAKLTGTPAAYDLRLESDLDDVVGRAIGRQMGAQLARLEGELQAAIAQKIQGPLQEVKASVGGFDTLTEQLTARLNLGQEVLRELKPGKSGLKLPF